MKIVLDTNVLVSGLLKPGGPSGEIVRMTAAGALKLCYDARVLHEYREVLLRPKFPFDAEYVSFLLQAIQESGVLAYARPLPGRLPDPTDEPFLEIALAEAARCLVTGNQKHFPPPIRRGLAVLSPADFLELYRRSTGPL